MTEPARWWDEVAGISWVEAQPLLDRQLAPLGRVVMEAGGVAPGEHVLDVGCGCGDTTLELARRVGPEGRAVGIDVSRPMLAHARARARRAGAAGVRFRRVDPQAGGLGERRYQLVYSRFGVMFFTEPERAFRNLWRALRPDGRLAFVCWQGRERNPWITVPMAVAARFVPLPPPLPPDAPGMFGLADAGRIRSLLAAAGFVDVRCESREGPLAPAGGDPAQAAALYLLVSPVAAALRESGADEATRAELAQALHDELARHATAQGVRLPSAAWLVTARRRRA